MTFPEYVELMRQQAAPVSAAERETFVTHQYAALLNQRCMRNLATFAVSDALRHSVAAIQEAQTWMVLTDPTCGDSSQIVPLIARIAECNPLIRLDLLLRDEHPDIMDAYLTGGKRSIPKLVAFNIEGRELFRWGPRPKAAQGIFDKALKEGLSKEIALQRVHLFYAKDKGKAVEREFLELLGGKGLD